jgi:glycosyltransferase involved in cell wall biosynthesis
VVRNPFNVPYDVVPTWPTEEGSQLRMACVARLHAPSKGQDLLFEALAEPPWTDRDWRLSLYGEGPNQALLEWFAEQLGLDKRIEFKGQVNDVAGIWAKHHLLVLPSRYEGLPLVLVEAMLCGRPAVVTDVAGNCEVVAAGVSGFVAEAPSKPALRRALEQAWEHRGELRTMGEAAAVRVRELTPRDPVGAFVDKLQALAGFASAPSHSRRAGALST